ncbi:MAG: hypothetical protein HQL97_00825 [Magnetococcales bacterium]|nr:hypothetical protein [Magnetococcales bacterium]
MRIRFLEEKVTWLKGFFLFYLFFLVMFFAAAPFLTLWLYSETSITRTLLPQLIGFCMQGGFLVVLFALYEKRATVDTRQAWKGTLRGFLAPLVDPCLATWKPAQMPENSTWWPEPQIMQAAIDALRAEGLNPELRISIQTVARERLLAMQSLATLAAQIDHDHLTTWMELLVVLRGIEQSEDETEQTQLVARMLETVVRFDELFFV